MGHWWCESSRQDFSSKATCKQDVSWGRRLYYSTTRIPLHQLWTGQQSDSCWSYHFGNCYEWSRSTTSWRHLYYTVRRPCPIGIPWQKKSAWSETCILRCQEVSVYLEKLHLPNCCLCTVWSRRLKTSSYTWMDRAIQGYFPPFTKLGGFWNKGC